MEESAFQGSAGDDSKGSVRVPSRLSHTVRRETSTVGSVRGPQHSIAENSGDGGGYARLGTGERRRQGGDGGAAEARDDGGDGGGYARLGTGERQRQPGGDGGGYARLGTGERQGQPGGDGGAAEAGDDSGYARLGTGERPRPAAPRSFRGSTIRGSDDIYVSNILASAMSVCFSSHHLYKTEERAVAVL